MFTWLDRLDQLGPAGPDRAAQAQPYTDQPVLAASAFGPNVPDALGGGIFAFLGLFWLIAGWRAARRGEAPAERFVLAITQQELLILRTGWGGWRVKAVLERWDRDDVVAWRIDERQMVGRSPASRGRRTESEQRALAGSYAICVENKRDGRRFSAKALSCTHEAGKVISLLTGA